MRTAACLLLLLAVTMSAMAEARDYSDDEIADAIYKAEGGAKTRHPYGILGHWHKPAREICINTIRHARRDWDGQGDFITFLGSRYCPPNAHPLNKNWVKNVKYFLGVTP